MKHLRLTSTCGLLVQLFFVTSSILGQQSAAGAAKPSAELQSIVNQAARETLERFANGGLKETDLAVTVIDVSDPEQLRQASFRGHEPIYPASVVKLFYLVAAHRWLEDKKIANSPELTRALRDMIVNSSNDATHHVVDALTATAAGPELAPAQRKRWAYRRNAINRYFASLGYAHINVNQKPWCEGPYGRERYFLGPNLENRNKLTTDATARLFADIAIGRAVNARRSAEMMQLLRRDRAAKSVDPDDQTHGFTGLALEDGVRLWSKAGWTSTARHDAAYVELPGGQRLIIVTFTTNVSREREIIPAIARRVISDILRSKNSA